MDVAGNEAWASTGGRACVHWLREVLGSHSQALAEKQNHLEGLFMVWEVQVELEKCFSNTIPGNADAGGLGN